ncbi:5-formyltetrahydrofolate cyclo-ligase [Enterococcus hermanniensis]|uniref:5-formyltetrahydrofolate cyclo-ligase n=1 Tax=Enterococcus hermanniensis TaxID=249189 RepID=A0A1L8TLY1_9ENTE|nr:5-formyltetrahydrofolate cyclo-ligase [Enterococcus hermanniensis]OJG45132.1 5-formyltetrahydrofolate cyclo-ligase [Enterococcus hermanniensis]
MEKDVLRQQAIKRLIELAKSETRQIQVNQIYDHFFESSIWKSAETIGVTKATKIEFPTEILIQKAFAAGKKIAVPKSLPKGKMVFHWVDPATDYQTTKFGVEEPEVEAVALPETIDLLIVPGLCFNHKKYRIGFGGGYYDRYLENYQGHTVSFVFKEQIFENWQPEKFDQAIDQLILAKKLKEGQHEKK